MQASRIHDPLSNRQVFALLSETRSAQNLMRDAVEAIRGFREPTTHSDAVFTLGSIGVEKTLKVMLGCAHVRTEGAWPSINQMKAWGHDIELLAGQLMSVGREQTHLAVAGDYVNGLIDRIAASTILPLLFGTLSRYGRSGRFHYLDVLATDEVGQFDAPEQYWQRLESHVSDSLGGPQFGSTREFDAFLARVAGTIAFELEVWWFAVHRLAIQGCFGSLGKPFGWEIWPSGRPTPAGL